MSLAVPFLLVAAASAVALLAYERHRSRHNRKIYYHAMDLAARSRETP